MNYCLIYGLILHCSDTQKFVQNIDQHLLESITTSQKKKVYSTRDLTL